MNSIDVFRRVSKRLIEATMMHNEFANIFHFLGLNGFAKSQEYQFLCENIELRNVNKFCIYNLNKLLSNERVTVSEYIPSELHDLDRTIMNNNDKQDVIKYVIETWVTWETETKEIYSNMCAELATNHDKNSELFLETLVDDVSEELCRATVLCMLLKNNSYDLGNIGLIQESYVNYYNRLMKKLMKGEYKHSKDEKYSRK